MRMLLLKQWLQKYQKRQGAALTPRGALGAK
jgi:hypothetical protein